ncbi:PilN domain-containing protein [Thiotrichales bacterium 19S11-10]|nr:PilN domain-containing protein [Thiotrichales bacterium 19S11-10]
MINFTINLMPWRQRLYQKRKKHLIISMILVVSLGLVSAFLISKVVDISLDNKLKTSRYLKEKLIYYSAMAKTTDRVKEKRDQLLEQTIMINALKNSRSVMVHLIDEIPKLLPDGVYLTEINKDGRTLRLVGVTDTNNSIAELMRRVEQSQWMNNPTLYEIVNQQESYTSESSNRLFSMTVDVFNTQDIN